RPYIRFDVARPSGRHPLEVENLAKSYASANGNFGVFHDFNASVTRGEKIAIIGRNGAGKTTLLKSLIDPAFGADGVVNWGHEVAVGYFAQDHKDGIPAGVTIIEWLHSWDRTATQEELRGLLGQMLFSGDDA